MIKRLFAVFFISLVSLKAETLTHLQKVLPEFEKYVEQTMKDWHVPGAAIGIVKDGKIIWQKGFGVKNIETKEPVTQDTLFQVASLTKNFTAVILAQLVEEKKLRWDDKVIKYLPDFQVFDQGAAEQFTILDLATHRSGLKGFSADSLWYLGWSAEEIYRGLKFLPPVSPLGTEYAYQNMFFGIAGMIIKKITGKPLEEVYAERIFKPLGLNETCLGFDPIDTTFSLSGFFKKKFKNVATPHDQTGGQPYTLPLNKDQYAFKATSGINSSVHDMCKWLLERLNTSKGLISSKSRSFLRSPKVAVEIKKGESSQFPPSRIKKISYGVGWFIHDYASTNILSHMGAMAGTRSMLLIAPEENLGIVILSNLGGTRISFFPEIIRSKFLDLYLKVKDKRDWSKELLDKFKETQKKVHDIIYSGAKSSSRPMAHYEGVYHNKLYGDIKFIEKNNKLALEYRDYSMTLTSINAERFVGKAQELSKSFTSTDKTVATFGFDKSSQQAFGVMVSSMHEGENAVFYRKR